MEDRSSSADEATGSEEYDELVRVARQCHGCDLYKGATQLVFGAGPIPAALMLIGEQPGEQEDVVGRPFVGPVGALLDDALEEAEIPRGCVYLTNVVKHFKSGPRGKRRLHAKPNALEIHACRGWLEREISLVRPEVIVCLGATAAQWFFGRRFRLTQSHGEPMDGAPWAKRILATYHPASLVRMKHDEGHEYGRARRAFTLDLAEAASIVSRRSYLRPLSPSRTYARL